ncbi:GlsB/YeaQ/YmgE family stress response membrane protein [Leptospira bourretii]|uniref:GlsB/YeaQ/YmgE family stress response membrane protein n=2 Tax=Leptospira TaxID=171 RepID=A0A4R9IQY3_9LEPT|nr:MULTISPECIES: GlsB/YeaQ/YmgE family stress response membrane protein [Leptospira]PKA24435.1 GlsB/YeaQ/YmgE family stress response membrane protein [Leptospira sp. mixed culture ATI2-C-A1]EKJ86928.1 transglycosylase associated protein [Leptospira meyeri serovar Hardjo str. Went 5]EMJ88085.1 transglycosylase associated protein [Leptospira meyeri serovar Semaranga str. Veldrot Semarang 173]MCG6139962.1 GlsB/YeaQ/YmgE family stress response membrane protein [Leptospira mtsangambouensis]MCW74884
MFSFIWFLLIGLVAGWLAGRILRGKGFGLIANLVIGVVGSFLGGIVFRFFGFSTNNLIAELIVAVVGAILLIFIAGMIKKR